MIKLEAALVGLAALAALAVGVYVWKRFDLGVKLDPTNPNNFAYAGTSSLVTAVAGRDESVGTAAYGVASTVGGWFRSITGNASADDINYSGPVTPAERDLVKRQSANLNPRDVR